MFGFKTGFVEKMRIDSSGNICIGTSPTTEITDYNEWIDIIEMSETNPALKSALDKLKTIYYLSKDHGSKT